jgi:phosphate acetyltransferase
MEIMNYLKEKALKKKKTIVFPEGENLSILRAAEKLQEDGLVEPILVGSHRRIQNMMCEQEFKKTDICIVDPIEDEALSQYISRYCEDRQMPEEVGRRIITQPLYYSAMMVKMGRAQGMVAGIDHPTEEVIMASELIFGLQESICVPSSFYLVEIPGWKSSQNDMLIFSDPSMNPDPSAIELADIAYTTAQSARALLEWDPKVALLSFSTKGSADHPMVNKIQTACEYLGKKNCDFLFDGELQADAAINPAIGKKKTDGTSPVAGNANILIFPDLNACNIASKLVQQFTGARFYGPILQGFQFPVSDLSRGATVEDIIGSSLLIAASK